MVKQQPGVLALPEHLLATVFLAAGASDLPALRLACKGFLRPANEATRCLTLRGTADVQLSHYHSAEEVDASQAAWSDSWLEVALPQVGGSVGAGYPTVFRGCASPQQPPQCPFQPQISAAESLPVRGRPCCTCRHAPMCGA